MMLTMPLGLSTRRHADDQGALGLPADEAQRGSEAITRVDAAGYSGAVLAPGRLRIEVGHGEHLNEPAVGAAPFSRCAHGQPRSRVAQPRRANTSRSPNRSPDSATPVTPVVFWLSPTPGVRLDPFPLNSCTDPASVAEPMSSPGTPTARRLVSPTWTRRWSGRTGHRLRPHRERPGCSGRRRRRPDRSRGRGRWSPLPRRRGFRCPRWACPPPRRWSPDRPAGHRVRPQHRTGPWTAPHRGCSVSPG